MEDTTFYSINPYNNEKVGSTYAHTDNEIENRIEKSYRAFKEWRLVSIDKRTGCLSRAGELLQNNRKELARTITMEMGKPISESEAEIDKCVWVCDFYAENSEEMLADEIIETESKESFVSYDPLGPVLAIMPWNYPFWQVFRFAAPNLMAGNSALLKHASNVLGCAKKIEAIFHEAGFPDHLFQNLFIDHDAVENVISHDFVRAVTLTGSDRAGRSVASLAGQHLKKAVLELGGNNAFIIWEDADLDHAVKTAVRARMMNSGQSCIAGKRFIPVGTAYEPFLTSFTEAVSQLPTGDPMNRNTRVGPLARKDLADNLQKQIHESVERGAELHLGGSQKGTFHEPTILTEVTPGMPAFDDETFGPLASVIRAENEKQAFELAANSRYGLGTSLFTKDTGRALRAVGDIEDGAFFINDLVKSDPRLPFGGTKQSGYGRELSREGLLEFVNKKTVSVF